MPIRPKFQFWRKIGDGLSASVPPTLPAASISIALVDFGATEPEYRGARQTKIMMATAEPIAVTHLESIVSASVASFKQTPGNGIIRRSLDGLGWFGDWLVDEDLPPSHPFAIRIAEALKIAWGSQIADPQASLVLAERLGVPVDIAIDMVSRHLERGQA